MVIEKVAFRNSKRKRLVGIVHKPDSMEKENPAVILCHGFGSSKDNKSQWANRLALNGYVVLRFDATGHGDSQGKLENVTVSQYVDDLRNAVRFLSNKRYVDEKRIGIAGSSLGGLVTLVYASRYRKPKTVVVIAPAIDYKEIFDKMNVSVDDWKKNGALIWNNKKIGYTFYKDATKLKINKIVRKIKCSVLIVHGDQDNIVPIDQSKKIIQKIKDPKKLVIMNGVTHDFRSPKNYEALMNITEEWFNQTLKG